MKLKNVSESERGRSIVSQSRSGVVVKNFRLRAPLVDTEVERNLSCHKMLYDVMY